MLALRAFHLAHEPIEGPILDRRHAVDQQVEGMLPIGVERDRLDERGDDMPP